MFLVPPTFIITVILLPPINTVRFFDQTHQCLDIWIP
jgi:hypothetical protein